MTDEKYVVRIYVENCNRYNSMEYALIRELETLLTPDVKKTQIVSKPSGRQESTMLSTPNLDIIVSNISAVKQTGKKEVWGELYPTYTTQKDCEADGVYYLSSPHPRMGVDFPEAAVKRAYGIEVQAFYCGYFEDDRFNCGWSFTPQQLKEVAAKMLERIKKRENVSNSP